MSNAQHSRWHAPSALLGACIALGGLAVGLFVGDGPGAPRALAVSPEAGDGIPAIELDEGTVAMVVDRSGIVFLVDQNARAFPVRYEENALRNVPAEEILRAR